MLRLLRRGRNLQIAIVAFLALIFLVWGIGGVLTGRQQPLYAGKIFDHKISYTEYARAWELTRQNLREIYRVDLPKELVDVQTWTRLLLLTEAKQRRLQIADQEVVDRIRSVALFQTRGAFDHQRYDTFLKFRHMAPRAFEEAIREDLLIGRLTSGVVQEISIAEADIRRAFNDTFGQARVAYALVHASVFTEQARAAVTPEQVRAYFDAHPQEFAEPSAVDAEYVAFRLEEMPAPTVTDEDAQSYYTTHQQQLAQTEPGTTPPPAPAPAVRDRVRQILERQRREDAFSDLAAKVQARLQDGKTLAQIAQEFHRPVRATGFFNEGQPVPTIGPAVEVAQIAFSLSAGQTSGWIETAGAAYILRVQTHRPARSLTFEEAGDRAQQRWIETRARALAQAKAEELAAACTTRLAAGETFDAIAQGAGSTVQRPEPFARTEYVAGLGVVPAFAQAAFALQPGGTSPAVETPEGFAVIQLAERINPDDARYAKERATFAETFARQKQEAHLESWLKDLKARAQLVDYINKER